MLTLNWIHHSSPLRWKPASHITCFSLMLKKIFLDVETLSSISGSVGRLLFANEMKTVTGTPHTHWPLWSDKYIRYVILSGFECVCVCLSKGGVGTVDAVMFMLCSLVYLEFRIRHGIFLTHFLTYGNINCLFHWGEAHSSCWQYLFWVAVGQSLHPLYSPICTWLFFVWN